MIFIFTIVNFEEKHGGIKINVVRDRDSGTLNNRQQCPPLSLPPPPPAPGRCVINILHDNSFEDYSAITTRFAFIFITCLLVFSISSFFTKGLRRLKSGDIAPKVFVMLP